MSLSHGYILLHAMKADKVANTGLPRLDGHRVPQELAPCYLFARDPMHTLSRCDRCCSMLMTRLQRYESYGWHVQTVGDVNDLDAVYNAIEAAKATTDKPSLIKVRSLTRPVRRRDHVGGKEIFAFLSSLPLMLCPLVLVLLSSRSRR